MLGTDFLKVSRQDSAVVEHLSGNIMVMKERLWSR